MIKQFSILAAAILLGVCLLHLALRPKVNEPELTKAQETVRDYLIAHGFKPWPQHPLVYRLEHVRLASVADKLGFRVAVLRPAISQAPDMDERMVKVGQISFLVSSEMRGNDGRIREGSLDDPNAVCTVSTSLFWLDSKAKQVSGKRPVSSQCAQ